MQRFPYIFHADSPIFSILPHLLYHFPSVSVLVSPYICTSMFVCLSLELLESNSHISSPYTPNISGDQCAFPKNKGFHLHSHSKITKFRKLTLAQQSNIICRPYSNFTNYLNNVLYTDCFPWYRVQSRIVYCVQFPRLCSLL